MTTDHLTERVYYVVEMTLPYTSLAEVQTHAPAALAEHLARSMELHQVGDVLMAGAFLQPEPEDGYLRTMAVCRSQEAAERFAPETRSSATAACSSSGSAPGRTCLLPDLRRNTHQHMAVAARWCVRATYSVNRRRIRQLA